MKIQLEAGQQIDMNKEKEILEEVLLEIEEGVESTSIVQAIMDYIANEPKTAYMIISYSLGIVVCSMALVKKFFDDRAKEEENSKSAVGNAS